VGVVRVLVVRLIAKMSNKMIVRIQVIPPNPHSWWINLLERIRQVDQLRLLPRGDFKNRPSRHPWKWKRKCIVNRDLVFPREHPRVVVVVVVVVVGILPILRGLHNPVVSGESHEV
jgi:hypothetical protein